MKLATPSLFAALLLALASVATAADTTTAAQPAAPVVQAEAAAAPVAAQDIVESNCQKAQGGSVLFQVAFEKPQANLVMGCGACSSAQCQGANRGQMCWTGGVHGQWGHCNIYSGGNICDTGGWECQCGVGPLP